MSALKVSNGAGKLRSLGGRKDLEGLLSGEIARQQIPGRGAVRSVLGHHLTLSEMGTPRRHNAPAFTCAARSAVSGATPRYAAPSALFPDESSIWSFCGVGTSNETISKLELGRSNYLTSGQWVSSPHDPRQVFPTSLDPMPGESNADHAGQG